jgi:hypothetical protein
MRDSLVDWALPLGAAGIYAAALIGTVSIIYIGMYTTRAIRQPAAGNTALTGLGGVKLSGFEVVVGSMLSVVLVVCVVLYGKLIEEGSQIESAKLLGAWRPERGTDFQSTENAIVDWLIEGERDFSDDALLETRSEWAVSLADQHKITKRGFRIADGVIHVVFWFIVTITALQFLLISQGLHGLRVLIPVVLVGFMIIILFLPSGASGLAPYFWVASNEVPQLSGSP